MAQSVMTVTGKDKPGIIARVTGVLFEAGANLEDVSMTILEGELAMILIVGCRDRKVESAVEKRIPILKKEGLTVLFRKLSRRLVPGKKHKAGTQAYLLTAAGSDRTGIVYKVSKLLAAYRCNITDLNSKILRKGKGKLYILMLEADFPHSAPLGKIEKDIRKLEKELEIEIQFKPVQFLEM